MGAASVDALLHALADQRDLTQRALFVATCSSLASLLLAVVVVWRLLYPTAYIAPAGGPGLVKAGTVDDETAMDYAKRWLRERWNFRPETYKAMQDALLETTHPSYTPLLKAELEKDFRTVREASLGAQLTGLTA